MDDLELDDRILPYSFTEQSTSYTHRLSLLVRSWISGRFWIIMLFGLVSSVHARAATTSLTVLLSPYNQARQAEALLELLSIREVKPRRAKFHQREIVQTFNPRELVQGKGIQES